MRDDRGALHVIPACVRGPLLVVVTVVCGPPGPDSGGLLGIELERGIDFGRNAERGVEWDDANIEVDVCSSACRDRGLSVAAQHLGSKYTGQGHESFLHRDCALELNVE